MPDPTILAQNRFAASLESLNFDGELGGEKRPGLHVGFNGQSLVYSEVLARRVNPLTPSMFAQRLARLVASKGKSSGFFRRLATGVEDLPALTYDLGDVYVLAAACRSWIAASAIDHTQHCLFSDPENPKGTQHRVSVSLAREHARARTNLSVPAIQLSKKDALLLLPDCMVAIRRNKAVTITPFEALKLRLTFVEEPRTDKTPTDTRSVAPGVSASGQVTIQLPASSGRPAQPLDLIFSSPTCAEAFCYATHRLGAKVVSEVPLPDFPALARRIECSSKAFAGGLFAALLVAEAKRRLQSAPTLTFVFAGDGGDARMANVADWARLGPRESLILYADWSTYFQAGVHGLVLTNRNLIWRVDDSIPKTAALQHGTRIEVAGNDLVVNGQALDARDPDLAALVAHLGGMACVGPTRLADTIRVAAGPLETPRVELTQSEKRYVELVRDCFETGGIPEAARRLLERRRNKLGVSERRAGELEALIVSESEEAGDLSPPEQEFLEEVAFCLESGDGSISPAEQSILDRTRIQLGIGDDRGAELVALAAKRQGGVREPRQEGPPG